MDLLIKDDKTPNKGAPGHNSHIYANQFDYYALEYGKFPNEKRCPLEKNLLEFFFADLTFSRHAGLFF